jgi:hypothetical protein
MPFLATLPNAAIKYRLSQEKLLIKGGSVGRAGSANLDSGISGVSA